MMKRREPTTESNSRSNKRLSHVLRAAAHKGSAWFLIVSFVLLTIAGPVTGARAEFAGSRTESKAASANAVGGSDQAADVWMVKRSANSQASTELPDTVVLSSQPEAQVELVRPRPGVDTGSWLAALRARPDIAYVHPNGRVGLLAAESPNDPKREQQAYLRQIRAEQAWEHVKEQTSLTIALVDTGVDLDHPDLKDNLVEGINLVQPGESPEDDNGHGTSVAGVMASIGNNGVGTTGILWKAKIMPIKALDENGYGDENRLGEAILAAVSRGAKIVVLSVGLYRYSPYMRDIVQYAENKGVLLVAASGNDGVLLGSKAKVKYPAAYPTVLAVSGVKRDGTPEPRSNPGTEIDLAAAWHVYTTAIGGGYKNEEGTSMAAPQVAAAAAMVWAQYPNLKPYQVRERLRQSAKDVAPVGRDQATGNGLLQIDAALTSKIKVDAFEPNDTREVSRRLPIGNQVPAQLDGGGDKDWYRVQAPADGVLSIHFQGLTSAGVPMPPVRVSHYEGDRAQGTADVKIGNKTIEWPVIKGENRIEIQLADPDKDTIVPYLLTADFRMASDEYEANDNAAEAFTLAPRTQKVTGSFHQVNDRDWFAVRFTQRGALKLSLETDTVRIDPALMIQRAGQSETYVDEHGDGETESSSVIAVTPGTYYFRVHNAASSEAEPVVGQYTLSIDVQTRYEDPNEPNDRAYTATPLINGTEYIGVAGKEGDQDWFQLRIQERHLVTLKLTDIPAERTMRLDVADKTQKVLFTLQGKKGDTSLMDSRAFAPGTYYVKVTADQPFDHQYYSMRADMERLIAGYRDIDGHWAESVIASLEARGVAGGTGEYRFDPDRGITRAEATAMTMRAFEARTIAFKRTFPDVTQKHWAYDPIMNAAASGIVTGLPDGTFGPGRLITRAEIAVMLARALGLTPLRDGSKAFADLDVEHWAAPMLARMKKDGIIGGYPGNTVRPDETASRAEFSAMIFRAIASQERG
jgi:hypothetical protein